MNPILRFGPMRLGLLVIVIAVMVLRPDPGTPAIIHGWGLLRTVIVPALVPLVFMVIMLDALMAVILRRSAEESAHKTYTMILRANLLIAAIYLLYWLPYFVALAT